MFQLNRVQYDMKKQKLVKDNSKFEFETEIYLDLFLNANKERSDTHLAELEKMKQELKHLKEKFDGLAVHNDIVSKFQDCANFMKSMPSQSLPQESISGTQVNNFMGETVRGDKHYELEGRGGKALISEAEVSGALKVMDMFRMTAEAEINSLK